MHGRPPPDDETPDPSNDEVDAIVERAAALLQDDRDLGDHAEGVVLLQGIVDQDLRAAEHLGWCYEHGRGVPRDRERATRVWATAAEAGSTYAQVQMGRRWELGAPGIDIDLDAATLWYTRAAEAGDADGMIRLGRLLALRSTIPAERARARQWLRRAADQGHGLARYWLRWLRAPHRRFIPAWRGALLAAGFVALGLHLLRAPVLVDWRAVASMLGVLGAVSLVPAIIIAVSVFGRDDEAGEPAPLSRETLPMPLRRLWKVPAEEGLICVPLLFIGVNPVTAALGAVVFGALHYPAFSGLKCAIKALLWFPVLWWVLPMGGVWSVVVGHLLWDLLLVGFWRVARLS